MEVGKEASGSGTKVWTMTRPLLRLHLLISRDREMQMFLIGYILVEICEIFTVGEFPLNGKVRVVSFQRRRVS